jgi:hypothetical protein
MGFGFASMSLILVQSGLTYMEAQRCFGANWFYNTCVANLQSCVFN